ncbi:MAG: hypothetical protein U0U70_15225 [Chitinophagaceae bacterium]
MKVPKAKINEAIREMMGRIEQALILRLQRIGENFVKNARLNGNYTDRTGNLRSSIGYVIIKNGLQLSGSDWIQIKPGAAPGIAAGQGLINELAAKYPTGIVLICVAGMNYAAAVESKGFDVISSSSVIARDELESAIKRITEKISQL